MGRHPPPVRVRSRAPSPMPDADRRDRACTGQHMPRARHGPSHGGICTPPWDAQWRAPWDARCQRHGDCEPSPWRVPLWLRTGHHGQRHGADRRQSMDRRHGRIGRHPMAMPMVAYRHRPWMISMAGIVGTGAHPSPEAVPMSDLSPSADTQSAYSEGAEFLHFYEGKPTRNDSGGAHNTIRRRQGGGSGLTFRGDWLSRRPFRASQAAFHGQSRVTSRLSLKDSILGTETCVSLVELLRLL